MISVLNPVKASMDNRILHPLTRIIAIAMLVFSCTQAVGDTQMDWQPPAFELADSDGQSLRYPDDLDGPAWKILLDDDRRPPDTASDQTADQQEVTPDGR